MSFLSYPGISITTVNVLSSILSHSDESANCCFLICSWSFVEFRRFWSVLKQFSPCFPVSFVTKKAPRISHLTFRQIQSGHDFSERYFGANEKRVLESDFWLSLGPVLGVILGSGIGAVFPGECGFSRRFSFRVSRRISVNPIFFFSLSWFLPS